MGEILETDKNTLIKTLKSEISVMLGMVEFQSDMCISYLYYIHVMSLHVSHRIIGK